MFWKMRYRFKLEKKERVIYMTDGGGLCYTLFWMNVYDLGIENVITLQCGMVTGGYIINRKD